MARSLSRWSDHFFYFLPSFQPDRGMPVALPPMPEGLPSVGLIAYAFASSTSCTHAINRASTITHPFSESIVPPGSCKRTMCSHFLQKPAGRDRSYHQVCTTGTHIAEFCSLKGQIHRKPIELPRLVMRKKEEKILRITSGLSNPEPLHPDCSIFLTMIDKIDETTVPPLEHTPVREEIVAHANL